MAQWGGFQVYTQTKATPKLSIHRGFNKKLCARIIIDPLEWGAFEDWRQYGESLLEHIKQKTSLHGSIGLSNEGITLNYGDLTDDEVDKAVNDTKKVLELIKDFFTNEEEPVVRLASTLRKMRW